MKFELCAPYKKATFAKLKDAQKYIKQNCTKDIVCQLQNKDESWLVLLYLRTNPTLLRLEHCKICREMHSKVYSRDYVDCSRCTMLGFEKRIEQELERVKRAHEYNKENFVEDSD